MKIHLGPVIARCERCGGTHFDAAHEGELLKESPALVCAACGRPATYAELILQMEPEAFEVATKRLRHTRLL
jgi:hypothetical protein